MRARRASGVDDWLERSVAAFLLLSVPLTLFLRHQLYGFATTEVFLLQLALAGSCLPLRALQLVTEVTGPDSCHLDSPSYQRVASVLAVRTTV